MNCDNFRPVFEQSFTGNGAGGGDKHYRHVQNDAAKTWNVPHFLDKFPSITVRTFAGINVDCITEHVDKNNTKLYFINALNGYADFN